MKTLVLYLAMSSAIFAATDEPKKEVPTMPNEVTLTSGRVLKRVQVIRWEKERVVLKHGTMAEPVPFSMIKSVPLADLKAMQVEANRRAVLEKAAQPAFIAPVEKLVTYSGQMFIPTRGAGSYKFGGRKVYVLPAKAAEVFTYVSTPKRLPKPLAVATTDADGKFTFNLAKDCPFFIFAQATRLLLGGSEEVYEWRISSDAIDNPDFIPLSSPAIQRLSIFEFEN